MVTTDFRWLIMMSSSVLCNDKISSLGTLCENISCFNSYIKNLFLKLLLTDQEKMF